MRETLSEIGCRRSRRKAARTRALLALGVAALIGLGSTQLAAANDPANVPGWDQVENIKEAAQRLAQLQRTQGATKAFAFIDACYRTHSLSSEYTKAFEACIAQDYMETQILSLIYQRTPPEALKKMGAPTPKMLAQTMMRRVGAAFGQYKVPKDRIAQFQRNVDEHGFPLFFKILFPETRLPPARGSAPEKQGPPASAPEIAPPEKTPPEPSAPEKKQ